MEIKRIVETWHDLTRYVGQLHDVNIEWPQEFVLRKPKSQRSIQANAYLWGVLYPAIRDHIRETTGELYTTDNLHDYFKAVFLPPTIVELKGDQRVLPGSSARLKVAEFAEFTQQIEAYFVADLGGRLPANPNHEESEAQL